MRMIDAGEAREKGTQAADNKQLEKSVGHWATPEARGGAEEGRPRFRCGREMFIGRVRAL